MTLATTTLDPTDITSPAFRADPFPLFKRWRDEQPVVPVNVLGGRAWLLTRFDDVELGLKDERLVKNKRNTQNPNAQRNLPMPGFVHALQTNVLDQDPPDHTRLRALVHQAFLPRLMARLQTRVHDLSHQLIDAAQKKGEMDLVRDFAVEIPLVVICDMLGVPEKDRAKFHTWSSTMTNIGKPMDAILAMPSMYGMVQYLRRLFRHYRDNPGDNIATMLVKAETENSSLSEDELVGMAGILLSAGHETTSGLIGNGTLALLQNPDQLARLKNEPDLMKPAVEELVRFAPPVLMATPRYAREDYEISGTRISRGDTVYAMIGSANHDERKFEQPDKLLLDRSNNKHLGFGQGIHYCLGAPLARLEATTAFKVLFERLPNLRLAVKPEALRWASGLVPRGMKAMPVKF
jgi:cytochrome P450 PksS